MSDFKYRLACWLDDHRIPTAMSVWLAFLVFVAMVGLCVHRADAADIQGSFAYPTQFEDGSSLSLAQIANVRVEYGRCSGSAFGTKVGEVIVTPPATTFTITGLAPSTYCLRAYAKTIAAAGGLESVPTGVVSKVIPFPPPKPPVLTVVNVVAYETKLHPVEGVVLGRQVGTVPIGTACVEGDPIVGTSYFEVPREAVKLSKAPKSAVIVARCKISS
jgi:hypothetical protein